MSAAVQPRFGPVRSHDVVVDPPLLCVAVEGSDNPRSYGSPVRRPFHLASRGITLPGDIQRSSMLLEVYKCVQFNRCSGVWGECFAEGRGVVVVVCPLQPSSSVNSGCPGPESSVLVSS